MKKILTFLLLIITYSLLLANCATKESKVSHEQLVPDTISQIDTIKNKCKMVDGGKAMILKKYELVNQNIKDEIISHVVDILEMEKMRLNVLTMNIFIRDRIYIIFRHSESNNLNVSNDSFNKFCGYFSVGKYDVVIKCPHSISLADINKLFKKTPGEKRFNTCIIPPMVGGYECLYQVGKNWNIYLLGLSE